MTAPSPMHIKYESVDLPRSQIDKVITERVSAGWEFVCMAIRTKDDCVVLFKRMVP